VSQAAIVVGAGIGGLAASLRLAQHGYSVELLEAQATPGGLLAPILVDGIPCDRGSHRLHAEGRAAFDSVGRVEWMTMPRRGRIVLSGRHADYPLGLRGFLQSLGVRNSAALIAGFLTRTGRLGRFRGWENDRVQSGEGDRGFRAFVEERVGTAAYSSFYEPYARKVWGMDPEDISQTVAKQRVSTSQPASVLLGRVRTPKTFLYPRDGMHDILTTVLDQLQDAGVTVRLGARFTASDLGDRPVLFSGHLSQLLPSGGEFFGHRGLYMLHTVVPTSALTDPDVDTWYIPDGDYWFGRVSIPARFSERFSHPDGTILCIEIPEGSWGPDVDFTAPERAAVLFDQLTDAGILRSGPRPLTQTFEPRVYPLYPRGWVSRWREALEHIPELGPLFPIGRQGLYLHCNIDHSVRISHDAADHVASGGTSRQWIDQVDRYLDVLVRD
jgi:UDP-galactopyranose mutase